MTRPNGKQSEVVQLRERIVQTQQAAERAVIRPVSGNLKHRFITRRMEQLGVHQERLATLVGEEASVAMICTIGAPPKQTRSGGACLRPGEQTRQGGEL